MKRKLRLVLSLTVLLAMISSMIAPAALADDISNRFDALPAVADPLLYFVLQKQEQKDPDHVVLKLDDMYFQFPASITGSLDKVAQYRPLSTGIKQEGLFYRQAFAKTFLTISSDNDSPDSLRFSASMNRPGAWRFTFDQTNVFHRIQNDLDRTVDLNQSPGALSRIRWQRTRVGGDLAVTKDNNIGVFANYSHQLRSGSQPHAFFEEHRFNCTDCHSVGFNRQISARTDDVWGGVRAHFPKLGVVDVQARGSEYSSGAPAAAFNFGGPFGTSAVFPNVASRDTQMQYQLYAGEGAYRLGAQAVTVDRTNQNSGQTANRSYFSVQGAADPLPNLRVTAGFSGQREHNSFTNNLGNDRDSFYFQAAYNPLRGLNFTGKIGGEDRTYHIFGLTPPTASDFFWSLRGDWRARGALKGLHVSAGYRSDNVDHPFFPTDMARKSAFDAMGTYSLDWLTLGARYNEMHGTNTVNLTRQEEWMAFVSAQFFKRCSANVSYTHTTVDLNSAQTYFFAPPPDIATFFGVSPTLLTTPIQSGFPYNARNEGLTASLNLPIGNARAPWLLVPAYRYSNTDSTANFLPIFPQISQDSLLRIRQDVYGVRVDVPAFKDGSRLGVGWEHDRWKDEVFPSHSGAFDVYSINYSKRY